MSVERAQALIELKRYDDAIVQLRKILATNPYDSNVLVHLGFAQLFNHDFADCLETADLAISVDYKRHGLHGLRGNALARLDRYEEAYESFELGLLMDPNSVAARVQYIEAIVNDPQMVASGGGTLLARATELTRQALELEPNLTAVHEMDARIKALKGQWSAAETAVGRALEIAPDSAANHNLLGVIQESQGKLRDAGDSYVAAARADPRAANPSGLEGLGKVVAPMGIGILLIARMARTAGRGADIGGASIGVVLLIIGVVLAIGFAIRQGTQSKPQARTDYTHLSSDAQEAIRQNKRLH